ncbi:MAG TPA: FG-GAP repeat protein [Phycisphaerae bacterium]|nr:FG-GAP repeat protein [Phycisphaerae bacterium]
MPSGCCTRRGFLLTSLVCLGGAASPAPGQCQLAKLTARDGAAGDGFGWAVSVAGEIGVIGAPGDDDQGSGSGAAYVFERSANLWVELAKLTADDVAVDDVFGWSVAVSGEVTIVGVPYDDDYGARSGSVYVFERGPSGWGQMAKLTPVDAAEGDYFGYSTAVSEDVLVVGAPHDDDNGFRSGSAYVF